MTEENIEDFKLRAARDMEKWHKMLADSEAAKKQIEEAALVKRTLELEIDHLRIELHDMKDKLASAESACQEAVAQRIQLETFVQMAAKMFSEFRPPSQMRELPRSVDLTAVERLITAQR